jgi:hypothetical protein
MRLAECSSSSSWWRRQPLRSLRSVSCAGMHHAGVGTCEVRRSLPREPTVN